MAVCGCSYKRFFRITLGEKGDMRGPRRWAPVISYICYRILDGHITRLRDDSTLPPINNINTSINKPQFAITHLAVQHLCVNIARVTRTCHGHSPMCIVRSYR